MELGPDPGNRVSRFLFNKEFKVNPFRIPKPCAFEPLYNQDPGTNRWELSVSNSDNIGPTELLSDGEFVARQRGKSLQGWAHLGKTILEPNGLVLAPSPIEATQGESGFLRHADLIGWPPDEAGHIQIIANLIRESYVELVSDF